MKLGAVQRFLPRFLRHYLLYLEAVIEDSVARLARELPPGALLLDAGAGEARHRDAFPSQRYVAVDLGVGDAAWDYGKLDVVADLRRLPFPDGVFDACLNLVTLEHIAEPAAALAELYRVLAPGARLLLVVPLCWEVHQAPHDYFRYTGYGARYLLEQAGFTRVEIQPAGGFFRLLARRLLNGLQFFPVILLPLALLLLVPPALALPLLDGLDRKRNFTLGYLCNARKPS